VSGSERVYVNGTLLKRGENNDYTIDYNAGEIVFTPLFTITEMRIAIEYQFSDRNYTCFVTHAEQRTTLRNGVLEVICIQKMMSKPTLATKFITGTSTVNAEIILD
jgi:hypothetical protein